MAVPSARPRGIRVRTACVSEDEFVAQFTDLCDQGWVFAPTEKMKPQGADCAFSLELADGTPMLRGLGVIAAVFPTADGPFGRPGIHIEVDQLTNTSEAVLKRLLAARAAAAKPRQRPAPSTHQLWGLAPAAPATEEMEAPEVDDADMAELPQKITREIRGVAPPEDLEEETREAPKYTGLAAKAAGAPPPLPRPGSAPMVVASATDATGLPLPAPPPTLPVVAAAARDSSFDLSGALDAARARPWWMSARVGGVFAAGLALGLVLSLAFRGSSGSGGGGQKVAATAAAPAAKFQPVANCPKIPAEPTQVAALEDETAAPAASVATPAHVATATAPAVAATKPAATKPAQVTTPPASVATTKPAATKPATTAKPAATTAVAKPAVAATSKPATTTSTKPTVVATKPAAMTTKPATKPAKVAAKKPAKAACSSLDCI